MFILAKRYYLHLQNLERGSERPGALSQSLLSFFADRESEDMENDLDYLENLRELLQSHSQKYAVFF